LFSEIFLAFKVFSSLTCSAANTRFLDPGTCYLQVAMLVNLPHMSAHPTLIRGKISITFSIRKFKVVRTGDMALLGRASGNKRLTLRQYQKSNHPVPIPKKSLRKPDTMATFSCNSAGTRLHRSERANSRSERRINRTLDTAQLFLLGGLQVHP
jgi:hypothetical protein